MRWAVWGIMADTAARLPYYTRLSTLQPVQQPVCWPLSACRGHTPGPAYVVMAGHLWWDAWSGAHRTSKEIVYLHTIFIDIISRLQHKPGHIIGFCFVNTLSRLRQTCICFLERSREADTRGMLFIVTRGIPAQPRRLYLLHAASPMSRPCWRGAYGDSFGVEDL